MMELVYALGAEMLVLAGQVSDLAAGESRLREQLASGAALECFRGNVERQGGDPRVVADPELLPSAPVCCPVTAPADGFVVDIDPLAIGKAVVALGGGRRQPTDEIDPRVGVVLRKKVGDSVQSGEAWAELHATDENSAAVVTKSIEAALRIAADAPEPRTCIHMRIG